MSIDTSCAERRNSAAGSGTLIHGHEEAAMSNPPGKAVVALIVGLLAVGVAACGSSGSSSSGGASGNTGVKRLPLKAGENPAGQQLTGKKKGGILTVYSNGDFEHFDPG